MPSSPDETIRYYAKEKEYYCPHCKLFCMLTAIAPRCKFCDTVLIVALKSIIDGTRITGNDELAQPDYRTTSRIRKS